jgi:hypothetical protein
MPQTNVATIDSIRFLEGSDPSTPASGYQSLYVKTNGLFLRDDAGNIIGPFSAIPAPTFKSYTITTQGLGVGAKEYTAGFYEFSTSDANLTQASTTQTHGSANVSYAAHAFAVTSSGGAVDTGVVGLRVNGTSIDDSGTRTTSDTETIIPDITAAGANEYFEGKKWLGQITYELFVVSGAPTAYSLDFNYGYAKYEDFGNNDFTVTDFEITGLAGNNDSDFDITLIHHKATGWTYSAAAFSPPISGNKIVSLVTDHSTDDQLANGQAFAYKRSSLSQAVTGSGSEGVLVYVSTSAINAVEYGNIHIGVNF